VFLDIEGPASNPHVAAAKWRDNYMLAIDPKPNKIYQFGSWCNVPSIAELKIKVKMMWNTGLYQFFAWGADSEKEFFSIPVYDL
jgi:hypothetical protein